MTSARQDGASNRGEGQAAQSSDRAKNYACAEPGCGREGPADQMFNLACNPVRLTDEQLERFIRCPDCAAKIAERNGKRPREPGCGVFPLQRTLAKQTELKGRGDDRDDYRRWCEAGAAKRQATAGRMRRETECQERECAIRDYALTYAEAPIYGTDGVERPTATYNRDGRLTCGLPLDCCDHDLPACRFLTFGGEVLGICQTAASVFLKVAHELEERGQDGSRMLWTSNPDQAHRFASRWHRQDDDDGNGRRR